MKYLKKIFEDGRNPIYGKLSMFDDSGSLFNSFRKVKDEEVRKREIQKLIDVISAYHEWLKKDEIWQDYYKDFENWRKSSNDSRGKEFLEEVIKFAEKRIEEIKAEFQKDLDFVKDLYLNYLEDCQSFSDYSIKRISEEYEYLIELKLTFSKESLQKRKYMKPEGYKITCDEVLDYWKNIYDFFVVLESNEYIPRIKYYQPNGVEFIIIIGKK